MVPTDLACLFSLLAVGSAVFCIVLPPVPSAFFWGVNLFSLLCLFVFRGFYQAAWIVGVIYCLPVTVLIFWIAHFCKRFVHEHSKKRSAVEWLIILFTLFSFLSLLFSSVWVLDSAVSWRFLSQAEVFLGLQEQRPPSLETIIFLTAMFVFVCSAFLFLRYNGQSKFRDKSYEVRHDATNE